MPYDTIFYNYKSLSKKTDERQMNKKLLVKKQGKLLPDLTLPIPPSGIVSVGNDASATIELQSDAVAPEQFVIVCEGGQLTLLCRVDNTQINENILPQGSLHNLEVGDTIAIGEFEIAVETEESAEKILSGKAEEPAKIENIEFVPPIPAVLQREENFQSAPPIAPPSSNGEKTFDPDKSLSEVLDGLRSEEKFYFQIENGIAEKRRIYVETEEMWLGWAESGDCVISENPSEIIAPRAQIRKDWSGVVLYPLKSKNIWLNNQVLEEPHRLKNDDSLQMLSKDKFLQDAKTTVRFHEPTALLVLDSILPKELPPPVSLERTKAPDPIHESRTPNNGKNAIVKKQQTVRKKGGQILGYFSGLEILIMIIGILVAAAFIFLVLEYF